MVRFLFVFLFSGLVLSANGQFRKDDWYVSPKISFASFSDKNDWTGYSISKIPPISVAVEKGLNDYFSIGSIVGYNHDKYINDTLSTNILQFSSFGVGALGTIHYAGWIEKITNYNVYLGDWDFYVSAAVLMVYNQSKEENVWNADEVIFENFNSKKVNFRIRPIFGLRYFVANDFCMLVEVGKGNLGMVTTGVSWRFN